MSQADQQMGDFGLPSHMQPGDVAPWWKQGRYKFVFDRAAGRYIVLSFFGSARDAMGQAALDTVREWCHKRCADDIAFYCVSADPFGAKAARADQVCDGLDFIWDTDRAVHQAYGVGSRMWIILDPMLRVIKIIPFTGDGAHIPSLGELLDALSPSLHPGVEGAVPILVLPNVFEPAFCEHLIGRYEAHGGRESGFMEEVGGKTTELHDPDWKSRSDFLVTDASLIELINERMARRVGVMVQRTFQFKFSRIERYLVACYSAESKGHFGPHRDDTVRGTEHRRFAVSVNLNAEFDGGGISFPEFSPREFRAPVGAAVIFSASLLHRVSKVTRGRRYAFLPFIHDEDAERVQLANLGFVRPPDLLPAAATGD